MKMPLMLDNIYRPNTKNDNCAFLYLRCITMQAQNEFEVSTAFYYHSFVSMILQ